MRPGYRRVMADGEEITPYPDPSPYSNPSRTEEVSVAGASGIVGGLLAGLSGTVLVIGLSGGASVFLLVAAAIGLVLGAGLTLRSATEGRSWDPLFVHFDQTYLALGSVTGLRVERRSRKSLPDVPHCHVDARIKCSEWIRYTVGTTTHTKTKTVFEQPLRIEGTITANTFQGAVDLEIPVDQGGPTLDLRNNKVSWVLEIDLEQISTVGGEKTIEFAVAAVLDNRHKRFVDAPPPPGPRDA